LDLEIISYISDREGEHSKSTFGSGNDLSLNNITGLNTVSSLNELKLDIMKILMTEKGLKYLDENYGSTVTSRLGKKLTFQSIYEYVKRDVIDSLTYLQTLNSNRTDPDEQIASIDVIEMTQTDPTTLELAVKFTTVGGKSSETTTFVVGGL